VITGCILFVAPHRSVLVLHLALTFVTIAAVVSHVALHAAHGGLAQLLRVVRPARLEIAPPPPDPAELLAEQLAKQAQPPLAEKRGRGSRHRPLSWRTEH